MSQMMHLTPATTSRLGASSATRATARAGSLRLSSFGRSVGSAAAVRVVGGGGPAARRTNTAVVALAGESEAANTANTEATPASQSGKSCVMQFVNGVDETVVPEVKLTRSRDGSNGVATFIFQNPTIFDNDADVIQKGEITGLYLIDEEGTLQTTDVTASFLDGKPARIEAQYVMKSAFAWDRFMRFMERYANENGLGFNKA